VAPQIIQNYVKTGKIKYVYKDLTVIGAESDAAAEAAACAADQGKFWEYHDTLFANHGGENSGAFSKDRLEKMAEVTGLDMGKFRTCVSKKPHAKELADAQAEAIKAGINVTPSFQINGKLVQNGNYQHFQEAIDAALKGS
jgi:protein-disulfide isomerase